MSYVEITYNMLVNEMCFIPLPGSSVVSTFPASLKTIFPKVFQHLLGFLNIGLSKAIGPVKIRFLSFRRSIYDLSLNNGDR